MAVRPGRRGAQGDDRTRTRVGAARRTQLITTYGVGSMIALGEQSYIISGLDSWKVGKVPDLREFRLQTRLGVKGFFLPPASDPPAGDGVRVRQFPELYTCPGQNSGDAEGCAHNLRPYKEFNTSRNRNECAACKNALTPSRFVIACRKGHLDEFPYWNWVHVGRPGGNETAKHDLSFRTTGRTASLRSIVIGCSCGKEASMEGAFGPGAMREIKYSCQGGRPWLGREARVEGCDEICRTLQRGSSAAWFPVVRSALSIPPFSQQLYNEVGKYYKLWKGADDALIAQQAERLDLVGDDYTATDVVRAVRDYESYEAGERPDPSAMTGFEAADVLRAEEFRQLSREVDDEDFECVPPAVDPLPLPVGIGRSMLVKRLREVRVLQTFTRVEAPIDGDQKARLADLSLSPTDWLPGIEVIGEGVFLSLDVTALRTWETPEDRPGSPESRARRIRKQHETVMRTRVGTSGRTVPTSPVRGRLLLVHTLAHALINEWSLDAGYPASALRERLYVSDEMAGVLIYTASSDSAGSLGGLVSQGETQRLVSSLRSALVRMSWCSADPLCMESEAAGTDSLNLAACHSCVLLPETSCELNNTFLDRAMLVGTPDEQTVGYFPTVVG